MSATRYTFAHLPTPSPPGLAALLRYHGLEWHRRPFTGLAGALLLFGAEYYVVTNSREGWARQRSTAAHELRH